MITPQANGQRNAITSALMNIANPPPKRPQLPAMAMAPPTGAAQQLPQQQPVSVGSNAPGPMPGAMPMGMPQDPPPGQAGAYPTPPINPTAPSPFTPMASAPGAPNQGAAPQQQGTTGQGSF